MAQTPKSGSVKKPAVGKKTTKESADKPAIKKSRASKTTNNKPEKTNATDSANTIVTSAIESNAVKNTSEAKSIPTESSTFQEPHSFIESLTNSFTTSAPETNINDDIELMDLNTTNNQEILSGKQESVAQERDADFNGFVVPSGCGNVLKAERVAQGLSLSEVCKSLRLSVNQIQAIEEDDFINLPKQSIVRGFIRNYARLLKIDAEPILRAFQNIVPDEAPLSLSVKATADESVIGAKEMKFTPKVIANVVFVIAVLFALAYLYTHYIKPQSKNIDDLALNADELQRSSPDMMALPLPNIDNNAQPVPLETAPVALADSSNKTPEISLQNTSSESQSSLTSTFEKKLNSQSDTVVTPTPAPALAPATTPQATPAAPTTNTTSTLNTAAAPLAGESQLTFKLTGQSWVRVETPDGKKIFSELLQAGSEQLLNAKPPFNIIIGNASVTKVAINRQDYDLAPVTRANVARVQIK